MADRRRANRALRPKQKGVWIATIAIVIAGVVAIALLFGTGERQRVRAAGDVAIGASGNSVKGLLGEPVMTCPAGASLDHLRPSFPKGWAPAATEAALQRMEAETAQRLVYPVNEGDAGGCSMASGATEIGLGRDGSVLWYVANSGATRLEIAPRFAPAPADAGGPAGG